MEIVYAPIAPLLPCNLIAYCNTLSTSGSFYNFLNPLVPGCLISSFSQNVDLDVRSYDKHTFDTGKIVL